METRLRGDIRAEDTRTYNQIEQNARMLGWQRYKNKRHKIWTKTLKGEFKILIKSKKNIQVKTEDKNKANQKLLGSKLPLTWFI